MKRLQLRWYGNSSAYLDKLDLLALVSLAEQDDSVFTADLPARLGLVKSLCVLSWNANNDIGFDCGAECQPRPGLSEF